jgi:spore coat protein CotH
MNNSDGVTNNYYFYKKTPFSPYEIIPWDFDKTFDYKINIGLYADNEIIKVLLKSDTCYSIYKREMKDILEKYFTELNLYPVINNMYKRIKDVYPLDPWLRMNGYNLETEITEIKNLITRRRNYLLELLK